MPPTAKFNPLIFKLFPTSQQIASFGEEIWVSLVWFVQEVCGIANSLFSTPAPIARNANAWDFEKFARLQLAFVTRNNKRGICFSHLQHKHIANKETSQKQGKLIVSRPRSPWRIGLLRALLIGPSTQFSIQYQLSPFELLLLCSLICCPPSIGRPTGSKGVKG